MRISLLWAVALVIAAYLLGYNIGEGDGYCHAKYPHSSVCDAP